MTKHPNNRAERIKLKNTKDRRKQQLAEAIKKQETEDALKAALHGSLPVEYENVDRGGISTVAL